MEEIKAGDIMLNNWVEYDGKYYQISALSEEYPFLNTDAFGVGVVTYRNIKGIPLTDDMLVKAGFIIGGYNLVEVTHPNYPRLFFVIMDDEASIGWNYNVSGTIMECEDSMIQIKYLHQLQNLFKSLTGNDLKIEV